MKNTLIISCHPYRKSFNASIVEMLVGGLETSDRDYIKIDLSADHFDPTYSEEELALYNEGKTNDKLVLKYQKILKSVDRVIMVYPIWWSDMPAILKGFFDKVMKFKFAFDYNDKGELVGKLGHIKKVTAITTMETNEKEFISSCGDSVRKLHLDTIWKQLGVKSYNWINADGVVLNSEKNRKEFLLNILTLVSSNKI